MNRLEAFYNLREHLVLARQFKEMNPDEVAMCVAFIKEHDHLDKSAFAYKSQMWFLDSREKPRHLSAMHTMVFIANGGASHEKV